MPLHETISEDIQRALKAQDQTRLSTLRFLKASLQNLAIEKRKKVLEDAEVLEVVARLIKQHRDSIEGFQKGGRQDLVQKEQAELAILKSYCGPELGDKELEALIEETVHQSGASGFGQVMKLLMPKVKGRADGQRISTLVRQRLERNP